MFPKNMSKFTKMFLCGKQSALPSLGNLGVASSAQRVAFAPTTDDLDVFPLPSFPPD